MKLKHLIVNRDLQGIVAVSIGSYIAAFFSYLLQFFLGRTLSIEDYGTFNTLLALSYILGIPAGVYATSITKYVSDLNGKSQHDKLGFMYKRLVSIGVVFGLVVFIILALFSKSIASYFKIDSELLIILYALSMAVSYAPTVPVSFLQGLLRYKAFAFVNVSSTAVRLILPCIFIFLGMRLNGVFLGLTINAVVGYFIGYFIVRKNIRKLSEVNTLSEYEKIFIYSFPVLMVNFGLILLNNIDLIVVKRLFTALETGYYSGTVTLGKILLFGTSTIAAVMFPKISHSYSQKKNILRNFLFFFVLQIIVVISGTFVFSWFPGLLTRMFFGERFTHSITLLPAFSIFICIYVLINFLIMFLLAIERTKVYLFLLPAVIFQFFALTHWAKTLADVIRIDTYITWALLTVLIAYCLKALNTIKSDKTY